MPDSQVLQRLDKLMSSAVRAHQSGRYASAEKNYLRAIKIAPQDAQVRYLIGLLYGQQGQYTKALGQLQHAVKMEPRNAEYLNHYGLALSECGEHAAGLEYLEQSLAIDTRNPDAHVNLVTVLMRLEEYDRAEACLSAAEQYHPDSLALLFLHGELYERCGQKNQASAVYARILERDPGNLRAAAKQASLLPIKSNTNRLRGLLEARLNSHPQDCEAVLMLTSLQMLEHRHDEAIRLLTSVMEVCNNKSELLSRRALAYWQTGRPEEARRDVLQLGKQAPGNPEVLVLNASIAEPQNAAPLVRKIDRALQRETTSRGMRVSLLFSRARILEGQGDYEAAFSCYEQANRLHRETYEYDVQEDVALFRHLQDLYETQDFKPLDPVESHLPRPVFIVGMPRSGTSLVEQILDQHSQIRGLGETGVLKAAVMNTLGLDSLASYPQKLHNITRDELSAIRDFYLAESLFDPKGKKFQTDKMPFNFLHLGLIRQIFPDSPVIYCSRELKAVALSIYRTLFTGEFRFAYSQEEIAQYCKAYRRLSAFWHRKFRSEIYWVNYEALVKSPQTAVRDMLQHCGLPWEAQCLRFHESKRPVTTASTGQVRRPIYRGAVDHWRRAEPYLQPLYRCLAEE